MALIPRWFRYRFPVTLAAIAVVSAVGTVALHESPAAQVAVVVLSLMLLWLPLAYKSISQLDVRLLLRFPESTLMLLMMAAASSGLFFLERSIRTAGELVDDPLTPQNVLRAALLGVVGLWVLYKFLARSVALRAVLGASSGPFVVYGVVAVLSSLWAAHTLASAGRALEVLIAYLCAAWLSTAFASQAEPHRDQFVRRLWDCVLLYVGLRLLVFAVSAVVHVNEALIAGSSALGFRLGFDFYGGIHPNTLGQLGAVVFVVALVRFLLRCGTTAKVTWGGVALVGLLIVIAAQARTAILGVSVLTPCILLVLGRLRAAYLAGTLGASGLLASGGTLLEYFRRGQEADLLWSFSGRTSYWAAGWEMFLERPLIGFGYFTGVRIDLSDRYVFLDISNADNTILEVLINNGLLGLVPFLVGVATLVVGLLRASRSHVPNHDLAIEMLGVLGVVLFRGLLGPSVQVFSISVILVIPMLVFTSHGRPQSLRRPRDPRVDHAPSPLPSSSG